MQMFYLNVTAIFINHWLLMLIYAIYIDENWLNLNIPLDVEVPAGMTVIKSESAESARGQWCAKYELLRSGLTEKKWYEPYVLHVSF